MKYPEEMTWDEIYSTTLAQLKKDPNAYKPVGKLTADENIHSLALAEVAAAAMEFQHFNELSK